MFDNDFTTKSSQARKKGWLGPCRVIVGGEGAMGKEMGRWFRKPIEAALVSLGLCLDLPSDDTWYSGSQEQLG